MHVSLLSPGTALGTVISIPTAGLIAGSLGWEWVFYIHGGLCSIWCVLWVVFVTDTPGTHKFISGPELDFIQATAAGGKKVTCPTSMSPY